jgi:RNA polymerase sigma-70 factor, ECF subfamily
MGTLIPFRPLSTAVATPREDSDALLVTLAQTGDAKAKETLYRRHARMVFGMVYRLLAADRDVDDLVQDVFVNAFSHLHQLSDGQAFAAWIGSITVRRVREHLRRKRLRRALGLESATPLSAEFLQAREAPADVLVELRAVYGALQRLPTDARIALVLRRVEGLTIDEIAAHMGTSNATVKRKIATAEALLESPDARRKGRS